ncbi:excalibur calcium-binding domain-containing protein [Nocardia sp. NPDC051030]|uniref:excalibur calcium-binding domain-containing protein n=1 Tax=Nocardia sp. NPDC051030 TaxID=3155162 RepID=UPI003440A557
MYRSDFRVRASVAAGLGALALGFALPFAAMSASSAEPRIDPNPPTTHSKPYPYYSSCAQVRAEGKAPLYAGQPGYNRQLDPEGKGVACGY